MNFPITNWSSFLHLEGIATNIIEKKRRKMYYSSDFMKQRKILKTAKSNFHVKNYFLLRLEVQIPKWGKARKTELKSYFYNTDN